MAVNVSPLVFEPVAVNSPVDWLKFAADKIDVEPPKTSTPKLEGPPVLT